LSSGEKWLVFDQRFSDMHGRANGLVFAVGVQHQVLRGGRISVRAFPYIKKEPVFSCHAIQKNFRGRSQHNQFRKQTANLQSADFET